MSDIVEKWNQLRKERREEESSKWWEDELAKELMQWSREAHPGEMLDRVCAWARGDVMEEKLQIFCGGCGNGPYRRGTKLCNCGYTLDWRPKRLHHYSGDGGPAMKLLRKFGLMVGPNAMEGFNAVEHADSAIKCGYSDPGRYETLAFAPTYELAIARSVAVLFARGDGHK